MGFFNRNKQAADSNSTNTTETVPSKASAILPDGTPSSPSRQAGSNGEQQSVYSESQKTSKTEKSDTNYQSSPDDEDDLDEGVEEEIHQVQEWDEGGSSHCGYSESIHGTLMSVGGSVHGVVGDPPHSVEKKMNVVANWFQEMSYAVRDFMRGQGNMSEDLKDVMNSVMNSESQEGVGDDEHGDGALTDTPMGGGSGDNAASPVSA